MQYGKVYLAVYKKPDGGEVEVAVKLARVKASAADKADFLAEAELMLTLQHPTMLKVYGLCIQRKPWLLVTEYMLHKDLGM